MEKSNKPFDIDKFKKIIHKIHSKSDPDFLFAKYRWEFLRRDPDYIKAYKKHKKSEDEKEVCKSFGLECDEMLNPELDFKELCSLVVKTFRESMKLRRSGSMKLSVKMNRLLGLNVGFGVIPRGDDQLDISIYFDKINSIDNLKKEISNRIDLFWFTYSLEHAHKTIKKTDYELILRIGDLKKKEGLTYEQIAEKVYPNDASPELAKAKVIQHHKKYKELVNGGHKKLLPI